MPPKTEVGGEASARVPPAYAADPALLMLPFPRYVYSGKKRWFIYMASAATNACVCVPQTYFANFEESPSCY